MTPKDINFTFSDGLIHDASVSEISQVEEICYSYEWSLFPVFAGLNGSPTWTLEVSKDQINWGAYDSDMLNAAINQPFTDDKLPFLYFRINYDAAGNTSGTVSFSLTTKK